MCVENTPVESLCEECLYWYNDSELNISHGIGSPSKNPCEYKERRECYGEIKWVDSCTLYHWYPSMQCFDPNVSLSLCTSHLEDHYGYWESMWEDALYGILR